LSAARKINPWLKAALEFGPLVLFFLVFSRFRDHVVSFGGREYSGFILATLVFIPVLVASTLLLWRLTGRLAPMQIATLVLVLVFGGLSLWFNDPRFFKMKPTMIYLLFAAALAIGALRGKSWLQLVMDETLPMTSEGWRILTWRFIAFFLALALANEVIWRTLSEQAWVNFKTFGLPAALFAFFIAQSGLFARHGLEKSPDNDSKD